MDVRPNVKPVPGSTVVLSLSSDEADVGSACTTLDEWVEGGWRSRWYWERSSPTAGAIPETGELACPAFGVRLPAEQTVALPADVPDGTWRIAYLAGEDDIGAYVFEVS